MLIKLRIKIIYYIHIHGVTIPVEIPKFLLAIKMYKLHQKLKSLSEMTLVNSYDLMFGH